MPDLTAGGIRIHYVSAPSQPRVPAIVLLHGAGANHTVWLGVMKALRERAWVVIPDLPGHGRSQAIPGLTIDEYARAILPFLEAIKGSLPGGGADGGLFLAGHSMGGAIALSIALGWPELLSGLVLVGSGAKLGVSPEILSGLRKAPAETQAVIARGSFASGADPLLVSRTIKDLAGTPAGRTLTDFEACNAFDVRARVGEIQLPALLLCGVEDRMTPPKYSEFLRDRMPRASLKIIERAAHAVMVEAPGEVAGAIASLFGSSGPSELRS